MKTDLEALLDALCERIAERVFARIDARQSQQAPPATIDDAWMTTPQAAAHLRISKPFLDIARSRGNGGPPFVKVGSRVRYSRNALDAWAHSKAANGGGERP